MNTVTHSQVVRAYEKVMRQKKMLYLRSQPWKVRLAHNPFLTVWYALADRFYFAQIAITGNTILPMKTFWGEKILMPFPNYRCVLHHGLIDSRELPVEDYFVKNLTSNDVFLDIGANVGFYSLLAHALRAQAWAFEPTPSTFKILKENIQKTTITPIEVALMEKEGSIDFLDKGIADGTNTAVINNATGQVISVAATTLDTFCTENNIHPTFLKIDVEEAEMLTLQGGEHTLKTSKPLIILETVNKEVVEYVCSLGYQAFCFGSKEEIVPYTGEFLSENLLFKAA